MLQREPTGFAITTSPSLFSPVTVSSFLRFSPGGGYFKYRSKKSRTLFQESMACSTRYMGLS